MKKFYSFPWFRISLSHPILSLAMGTLCYACNDMSSGTSSENKATDLKEVKLAQAKQEMLTEFLRIEKNNSIRDFLMDSGESVYFLDLLITEVRLKRNQERYSYLSSLKISKFDSLYVDQFIKRISGYLEKTSVDSLTFELMLPVDNNEIPKPPPPAVDFFGNTKGGKVPDYIPNPYLNDK